MSLSGTTNTYQQPTLDGLTIINADEIYVNGVPIDTSSFVPYLGATNDLNLQSFNLTAENVNSKNHNLPQFISSISTVNKTVDSWSITNSISDQSISYLQIKDTTNNSTIVKFQNNGIADFANTKIRLSTIASHPYDTVNLSTLTNAVAYIENGTSLTYVPYTNPAQNLNMGASTIQTIGRISAGYVTITSSISNADYSVSVNGYDQLEFKNLLTNNIIKTDGSNAWIPGNIYSNSTVYSNDLQLSGSSYFAYGSPNQWATLLNGSGEYEIQDNNSVMRLKLSKSSGLTISTLNITQVPIASPSPYTLGLDGNTVIKYVAPTLASNNTWTNVNTFTSTVNLAGIPSSTPTYALGVNGGGQIVSFTVPTGTNYLSTANTWTNTNTFNSTLTASPGYTTNLNSALATQLNSLGFSSASFTTTGITGSYSPPLGTLTNVSGSLWQIAQTSNGQSVMAISGFSPIVGTTYYFSINIKCTVGTATMYVEQNNSLRSPTAYALSTSFQVINGSFYYDGTANTIVFRIYTGTASWNAQWDSFILSTYSVLVSAPLTLNTLTASRALITDGSKNVSSSVVTSTELGYLSGTTSAVQTQLNTLSGTFANYLPLTGGTLTGNFSTIQSTNIALQGSAWTLNLQPTTTSLLQTAGLSAQSIAGVISGSYTLTPNPPSTGQYAGMYSPSQTFIAGARYGFRFTGFSASAFGMSLTIYQANVANTATLAISSAYPTVSGTFEGEFLPNSNASYLGQVYLEFSNTKAKTVSWASFTYTVSTATVNGNSVVNGDKMVSGNLSVNGNETLNGSFTMEASPVFLKKGGNSGANFLRILGNDLNNSPYMEFWMNNVRRGYIGYASASEMNLTAENGAGLTMYVGGTRQLNLNATGKTYFERNEVIVNGSGLDSNGFWGQYRMVYGNYGTFFRMDSSNTYFLITNPGDQYGQWNTLRPLRIEHASGLVAISNGLHMNSSDIYVSRMLSNNGGRRMVLSDTQEVNYIINNTGTNPISFTPASWASGGYTVFGRDPSPYTSMPALGIGGGIYNTNFCRAVFLSLSPGYYWGEVILGGSHIYTSCYGTVNLYTNGGGWVYISDKRLKKDIRPLKTHRSLERIMALKPMTYKKVYRPDKSTTPIPQEVIDTDHIGFLAQDVIESNPHCVSEWTDENSKEDGDDGKRLGIAYGDINIHMVGAIQELKKQLDEQEKEIADLREYKKLSEERFNKMGLLIDRLLQKP